MRTVLAPCGFGLAVLFVAVPSALAQSPFDFTSAIPTHHGAELLELPRRGRSAVESRLTHAGSGAYRRDYGAAIVPGRAEESRLYRVVAGLEEPSMPMEGDALTDAEVAAVRQWINDGAHWDSGATTAAADAVAAIEGDELTGARLEEAREYWAFQLPVQAQVPDFSHLDHPIDRFVERTRRDKDLRAAPRADSMTLLRRAYLHLIGLPPTPAQTKAFLADTAAGAWERLIDRLLASPHYGERWGRHWLDVARYADSSGFEHDRDRPNAWRYRDYVIDAFNDDKPYDRFIKEQIAGDELDDASDETRIATGFPARPGRAFSLSEKDNPERRHDYLDDMIATIGRGVLGLTVHCPRCHDHKFDPIAQKDYYQMQASIYGFIETEYPLLAPAEAEAYRKKNQEIDKKQQVLEDEVAEIEAPYRERMLLAGLKEQFPDYVQRAVLKPESERTPGEQLLAVQNAVPRRAAEAGGRGAHARRRRTTSDVERSHRGVRRRAAGETSDGGDRHRWRLPLRAQWFW